MGSTRMLRRPRDGPPVYTYEPVPGVPSVGVVRFLGSALHPDEPPPEHAHSHDFLMLAYFERAGGSLRVGDREWPVEAGDVYVVAPGVVVGRPTAESASRAAAIVVRSPVRAGSGTSPQARRLP